MARDAGGQAKSSILRPVERQLKERLIGAAVLLAAAVILIPELLSGPPRAQREQAITEVASEPGMKTFTIDLTRPPGSAPVPAEQALAGGERAGDRTAGEPALRVAQEPASAAARESHEAIPVPGVGAPRADASAAASRSASPPAPAPSVAPSPDARDRGARTPPAGTAPPAAATRAPATEPRRSAGQAQAGATPAPGSSPGATGSGWAVQLGSFASRETAERMVADLQARRHRSFVMPVKSGGRTLYRVRIGPMSERAAAEAELRKVRSFAPNAAIVAHP